MTRTSHPRIKWGTAMGAWGTGTFENDDAAEFESQLTRQAGKAISSALRAATSKNRRDESWCSVAVAAAEVIAAANGHPPRGFAAAATDAHSWLTETGYRPTPQQTERAAAIVAKISASSALADLWRESGSLTAWRRSLQSLLKRLAKPPGSPAIASPQVRRVAKKSTPQARQQVAAAPPPISRRAAKQILEKKADGMLYDHPKDSVDVALSQLKKVTRADAAALATLRDVREIDLERLTLSADKQEVLATLLHGWKEARILSCSRTKRVVPFAIPRLADFQALESLDLSSSDVTDTDLKTLLRHPSLRVLNVSSTRVTNAVFDIAQSLPQLEDLVVHTCPRITIEAASRFSAAEAAKDRDRLHYTPDDAELGLTKASAAREKTCAARNAAVEKLIYREWHVWVHLLFGHVGFGELPDLDKLAFMAKQCLVDSLAVGINESPIHQESADRLRYVLRAWPGIRRLSIENAETFDDSMAPEIAALQKLEVLEIHSARISDAMVGTVAGLPHLRRLRLSETKMSATSLRRLATMPHLRWLTLSPSATLPRADIVRLRKKLAPQCYVECLQQSRA